MRTLGGNVPIGSNVRSPRFRRDPFVRDVVFDHGRASAPRITGAHMLPSTLLTVSASAISWFSRLNSTPHTIKLTKQSSPDGQHHHFIPLSWVDHVDQHVHLNKSGADVTSHWQHGQQ